MKTSLTCCAVLAVFAVLAPAASAGPRRDNHASDHADQRTRRRASPRTRSRSRGTRRPTTPGRIHAYIAGGIYHPGDSTTKTFTGLVPNTTRTYYVQAIDPSGNMSGLSDPVDGDDGA